MRDHNEIDDKTSSPASEADLHQEDVTTASKNKTTNRISTRFPLLEITDPNAQNPEHGSKIDKPAEKPTEKHTEKNAEKPGSSAELAIPRDRKNKQSIELHRVHSTLRHGADGKKPKTTN